MAKNKQVIFKQDYIDKLKKEVVDGTSIDKYFCEKFIIDDDNCLFRCQFIDAPDNLELIADIEHDFENAVKLYEAFPNLLPIQASSEVLWTTLAHTTLFDYVRNRWQYKRGDKKNYILNYWFVAKDSALMRNALAGLWWSVYLTIDEEAEEGHKYDLTKILFQNQTLRTRVFGSSLLIRHREAARGILDFIRLHPFLFKEGFERKARYIMRYFNQLGASKQLTTLDEDFFFNKMRELYDGIISAGNDETLDIDDQEDDYNFSTEEESDSNEIEIDDDFDITNTEDN